MSLFCCFRFCFAFRPAHPLLFACSPDVRLIFGTENMQAATIETATNRDWYRLVGRGAGTQFRLEVCVHGLH